MMFGSLYKMCSSFFNKTISLLRILDMFIALAPEIFIDSYYLESNSLTKRIIQVSFIPDNNFIVGDEVDKKIAYFKRTYNL